VDSLAEAEYPIAQLRDNYFSLSLLTAQ